MEIYNPPGLVSGLIILSVSVVAAYRAYGYLKTLETPISRRLAYLVLLSSVFSIVGSAGTIIESGTGLRAWWAMATFFTLSYVTILTAIFTYLRLLHQIGRGKVPEIPTIPSGTFPAPKEERERTPLPVGGFTVQVSELSKIKPLCRLAIGVLYAGRSPEPKGCPSFDRVVWITRIGAPGSVDPSKLHVLQGEIMRFISEKGSGTLVIIDGVEHFLLYNDFRGVVKFLTALKDYSILTGSTLIVAIDSEFLQKTQLALLNKELPPLNIDEIISRMEEKALFGALSRELMESTGQTKENTKSTLPDNY